MKRLLLLGLPILLAVQLASQTRLPAKRTVQLPEPQFDSEISLEWALKHRRSVSLEIYVVVGMVAGLPAGVYRYEPQGHKLRWRKAGDLRRDLSGLALEQTWVRQGAIDLVFAAVSCLPECLPASHRAGAGHRIGRRLPGPSVRELLTMRRLERPLRIMPVGRRR